MINCLVNHHLTGNLVYVHISKESVMMSPMIDNPASCEIRTVTHFLRAINMSAAEIHCELCAAYGQNVLSEETVRQWCRMFKDG
jgi:hypothetical protein